MLASSLSKLRGKKTARSHEPRVYRWKMLLLLPAWVTFAYAMSYAILYVVFLIMALVHVSIESLIRPAILQTVVATIIYALTIAISVGVPYLITKRKVTLATFGLQRLPTWTDIGLAPVTFLVYSIVATIVMGAVVYLLPQFPVDQAQNVGFNTLGSRADNMLAFVALVILAPVAEESLFRGYLYGKLKAYTPAIWAALVTSLLFGVAHLQLNVGINVFVLSLFLCWLRSLTGSIWAGILVHMIKNGIAYYLLFVTPLLGQ